ncbi:MAG TPA: sulfate ABC transporter permease subunit [Actinomycetota bacterium]|jgi:sulfate transport system permease protein|nr:sulfate ABC transporter permease subunit [Actinomycetota bacterium]
MSEAGELRVPVLPSGTRRKLVHGGFIAIAFLYVGILVIAPLIGIAWAAFSAGWSTIVSTLKQPDVLHAFYLTGVITVITVIVTSVFGVIVALVIARDRFPGRALMSALVDLPLAVSPVIVGLMAVVLFGLGGWFEPWFTSHGIRILFAVPSMVIVTIFICIPFVIREVVPVLQEVGVTEEEAARTLGASAFQTFFRVTLKNIRWGLLYGIALTTARSIGEIGAVLIVSGQITGQTETATLYVLRAFDQFQDQQGYIVALTLALVSIVLLVLIEIFKRRQERMQRT